MAVTLSFRSVGEQLVERTLAGIADRLEDATPAFEAMRDRFLRAERRLFTSEGRAAGGWAPLSPRYAAWKAHAYPGKTILRRTDELFDSLTEGPQINIIGPDRMILGTAVPYAEHHQRGSGRLPRRPVVALTEHERRQWVKILQSLIVTGRITGVTGLRE